MGKFLTTYSTGDKVGDMVYLKEYSVTERKGNRIRKCIFKCFCGKEAILELCEVKRRRVRSCGCLKSGYYRDHGSHPDTYYRAFPEYNSFLGMKTRCFNKNHPEFKNYGGRGITVCERWIHSFENFIGDMGERPSKIHSLDRYPNKNGNYEPSNCRWATPAQQSRNTRRNINITYNGVTQTITEWSAQTGISFNTLRQRFMLYPIEYLFYKGLVSGRLKDKIKNIKNGTTV